MTQLIDDQLDWDLVAALMLRLLAAPWQQLVALVLQEELQEVAGLLKLLPSSAQGVL
jgi:hypothetical protein